MSNPPASLAPDNTSAFWENAWSVGQTGWKIAEAHGSPFDANVFRALCAVGWVSKDDAAKIVSGNDDERRQSHRDAIVGAFVRFMGQQVDEGRTTVGMNCFVPLCGDTGVVRYLFDVVCAAVQTIKKDLPKDVTISCQVSGVDLARVAIDRMVEAQFGSSPFTHEEVTAADATLQEIVVRRGDVEGVSARLFVGDLFDASKAIAGTVSFVYDTASMVAMHPSLRSRYVQEGIKQSLRLPTTTTTKPSSIHSPIVYLIQVMRTPDTRQMGPPFHIPVASLTHDFYTSAEGWSRYVIDDLDGVEELSQEGFLERLPTLSPYKAMPVFAFVQHVFVMDRN